MARYRCLDSKHGQILVRPARERDVGIIASIGSASFPESSISRKKIRDRFSRGHRFFVAEFMGEPVGFVDIKLGRTSVLIAGIATDAQATGKGVGSALLEHSMAFAKRMGKFEIELRVLARNARAVELYKAHGFVILRVESRKDDRLVYRMFKSMET